MVGAVARAGTGGPQGPQDWWEEARALLLLRDLPGVGDGGVQRLVDRFGSGREALGAGERAFSRAAGDGAARARGDPSARATVDRALGWCARRGALVVPRGSPSYPARLHHNPDPPAVLFLLGDAALLEREVVVLVGSRRSTSYGRRVARDLGHALARQGVVVASGLALGVDGEAHAAALEAPGSTLAVLGCGPDRAHPPSHAGLFRRICRQGLAVSEFLPGQPPLPFHFPRRNRILAALSQVVVVIEAAQRSGALITADHALSLGRKVMAVPGPIDSVPSRGTNQLIQSGATPCLGPLSVLEQLRGVGAELSEPVSPPRGLGDDAERVWTGLREQEAHVGVLARRVGLPARRTLVALSVLEVEGWVRQEPGMRFTCSGAGS